MTTASTPPFLHVAGGPPSVVDSSPCSPSSFAVDDLAGVWRQCPSLPSDASFDASFSREDRVEDEIVTALNGEILPKWYGWKSFHRLLLSVYVICIGNHMISSAI